MFQVQQQLFNYAPNTGDTITVTDISDNAGTNNITIDRNSEKIEGALKFTFKVK